MDEKVCNIGYRSLPYMLGLKLEFVIDRCLSVLARVVTFVQIGRLARAAGVFARIAPHPLCSHEHTQSGALPPPLPFPSTPIVPSYA